MAKESEYHLSLYDFRDLDLMLQLAKRGDYEGWAETNDIAEAIGMGNGGVQNVGVRFSWMKRYGILEYSGEKKAWRLSAGGRRVVEAHLRAAQAKALATVPEESMIEVMSHVTSRYRHGDPMMAHLLRREFAFGTNPRSAVYRS